MPLRPGSIRYPTIIARNKNQIPIKLTTELRQAKMEVNGSLTYIDNEQQSVDLSWIEVTPESLKLAPLRTSKFKTRIITPEDFDKILKSTYVLRITASREDGRKLDRDGWGSHGEHHVLIHTYDAKSKPALLQISKFEIK